MKRILIIDDEADSLAVMQAVFEAYTCRVSIATTGEAGIQKAVELKPEIILLDLRLPDMRGEEVLKVLKAKVPQSKVVIGTAYGDQKTKDELFNNGADGFFDKPISLTVFEKKVRQLVGGLSEVRLLAIDDETDFCEFFTEMLANDSETKWIVHTAQTGDEGLKLAQELMPDLITLDLELGTVRIKLGEGKKPKRIPRGVDVYRALKDRGFQIPVVILASYIDGQDVEDLRLEGVATVFSKIDLMAESNRIQFFNILKRIALRGAKNPKSS